MNNFGSVDESADPAATPDVVEINPKSSGVAVADVAKRLGVAPATLRTWHRRYGLGPSERTAGAHRRYTSADIERLETMRSLTLDGVAPADAARTALGTDEDSDLAPDLPDAGAVEAPPTRPVLRAITGGAPEFGGPNASPAKVKTSTRVGGIVDAALVYEQDVCDQLLRLEPGESAVDWWTKIVEPAWARIAERTVLGTPGEAPELVLASAALGALRKFTRDYEQSQVAVGNPPVNHPSRMRKLVLIFAPIDEDIPLAAHALAAALVSEGATARVVTGPASPHRAVELVTMVRPAALVLATSLARPDLGIVAAVHEAFPELPLLVSMQRDDALADLPLAPSVQRVRSFAGLVHEVLAIVE